METWDALTARRNVREFDDRPIAADELDRILEAGPPRAVVEELAAVGLRRRHRPRAARGAGATTGRARATSPGRRRRSRSSPATPADQHERDRTHYDFGQATMAMMLAAADLGIGSGHAAVNDEAQARARSSACPPTTSCLPDRLRLPRRPAAGADRTPNRRPFDEVVHRGRW